MKYYLEHESLIFEAPRPGDAGYDLRARWDGIIYPKQKVEVFTGLRVRIPQDHVGIIKDKSGVARSGVYTHGGVIDSIFTGEIVVLLENTSDDVFAYKKNQKIAQMVVIRCLTEALEKSTLEGLGNTVRGGGGFGSTGIS